MRRLDETIPKKCSVCGEIKNASFFYSISRPRKDGTHGLKAECKKCANKRTQNDKQRRGKDSIRAYSRKYYKRNKVRILEYSRKWRKLHPDKRNEATRKWRKNNRFAWALIQSRKIAKAKGFVPCIATKEELKKTFTGHCMICDLSEGKKKLHLDHDHETGEFRGWLCHKCNIALGLFNDSAKLLYKAMKYLDK